MPKTPLSKISLERHLIDKHNLAGKSFGKWTVIEYLGRGVYKTQCDCGHVGSKKSNELMHMRSTQCGNCRRKELRSISSNRMVDGIPGLMRSTWSNPMYSIKVDDLDEQ